MVHSGFGEVCSCCCLPALPGPAWVLLNYVVRTILLHLCMFQTDLLKTCIEPYRTVRLPRTLPTTIFSASLILELDDFS